MAKDELRIATEEEMAEDAIATATEATEFTRVNVEVEGRKYVLEYSRAVVKAMEASGFSVDSAESMPVTMTEALVLGAFEMHHPDMTEEERMDVWAKLPKEQGGRSLLQALVRLYMVPINSLMADPTTTTATWTLA